MAKDTPQYRYYLRNREARNEAARDRMRKLRASPEGAELHREQQKRSNDKLKTEVFNYYGAKCACCGETEPVFLTIDHVNDDGAEHRREIGRGYLYRWLRQNGYPEGFQTLCWNCQWGKRAGNGVCPHQVTL